MAQRIGKEKFVHFMSGSATCQSLVRMIIVLIIAMTIIIVTTIRQMLEHLRGALEGVLGV